MQPVKPENSRTSLATLIGAVLLSVLQVPAQGGEFAWGVGYTTEYSDNIRRVPTSEEADWTHSAVAGLSYTDRDPEHPAYVVAIVDHRRYQNDTYEPETLLYVDATAQWVIAPQRFSWMVQDVARPVLNNPRDPNTPNNRTGSNAFGTGPDFLFRFSPRNAAGIGGRYVNVYYQDADYENDRYLGYIRWLYTLSRTSAMSLNLDTQQVEYRNPSYEDYRRDDAFVRYALRDINTDVAIDAGYTVLTREQSEKLSGWLGRVRMARRVATGSALGLRAYRELNDTGSSLLGSATDPLAPPGLPTPGGAPASLNADVYLETGAELYYTYDSTRWLMAVRGSAREINYDVLTDDRREYAGRLNIRYLFTPLFGSEIFSYYTQAEYLDTPRDDETLDAGIRFDYRLGRNVYLALEGRRSERRSSDPGAEYIENRGLVGIAYSTSPGLVQSAANYRRR